MHCEILLAIESLANFNSITLPAEKQGKKSWQFPLELCRAELNETGPSLLKPLAPKGIH